MSSMPPPPPPPGGDQGSSQPRTEPGGPSQPPGSDRAPASPEGGDLQSSAFPAGPAGAQRNSMAVAALVLGLIAFPGVLLLLGLTALLPPVVLLALATPVAAIVAIVLGVIGIRRAKRPAVRGGVPMSVTGIVLGAINLLLALGGLAAGVWVTQTFMDACPQAFEAGTPEAAMAEALECAEEEGWLEPGERELLEEELQGELEGQ